MNLETGCETRRWLDVNKYTHFMTNVMQNPDLVPLIEKIVTNTHYYETSELIALVRNAFLIFVSEHPQYNLLIPRFEGKGYKIGSEHFLLLSLGDLLKPIEVLDYKTAPTNTYPIIVIDDAIYSGCNMCAMIDEYTYHLRLNPLNYDFYAIVGICSSLFNENLNQFGIKIIASVNLDHLQMKHLFTNKEQQLLSTYMNFETDYVIPLFFEHKIANEFGTYFSLYNNIISININRKCIDDITVHQLEDFIERLNLQNNSHGIKYLSH